MLNKRRLVSFAQACFVVLVSAYFVGTSETFQKCVADNPNTKTHQAAIESIAPSFRILKTCTSLFLHENREELIALFTIVLAVTTIFLWRATRDAAVIGARAANTAERALTELERPFVFIEVIESGLIIDTVIGALMPEGALRIHAKNFGRTPADLLNFRDDVRVLKEGEWPDSIVPAKTEIRSLPPGTISGSGDPFTFRINLTERVGFDYFPIPFDSRVFLIGYIRYADIFADRYITGFCAVFDPIGMRFVLRGDERYNYTRKE